MDRQGGAQTAREVGLVLTFPIETVFPLVEYLNTGRLLDKDTPVGESYSGQLAFNFFLAEYQGMWVRFLADEKKWFNRAKIHIARHEGRAER